jgi:hypothetical protein
MDPARQDESRRKIAARELDILLPGHGVPILHGASAKIREFIGKEPAMR